MKIFELSSILLVYSIFLPLILIFIIITITLSWINLHIVVISDSVNQHSNAAAKLESFKK